MSKVKVTDEWLYETMPLIDETLIKKLKKNVDYEHEFSLDFEMRMKTLLTEKHMDSSRKNKVLKMNRMAAGMAMVILVTFVTATSAYAYKIHFFLTIKTAWEDSALYTYLFPSNEEDDMFVFENIKPCYVPEGYRQTAEKEGDLLYSIIYQDEAENQIIWDQQMVTNSLFLIFDNEYQWMKEIPINDGTLEIFGYDDGHTVSYYESQNYIFMITADDISIEQIKNMIKK